MVRRNVGEGFPSPHPLSPAIALRPYLGNLTVAAHRWPIVIMRLIPVDKLGAILPIIVAVSPLPASQIWHGQASALFNAGCYRAAVEKYDRVLQTDPADVSAWISRGYALCELKQYAVALESFQTAIQLAPKQSLAWHGQGIVQAKVADFTAALESFDRTIALNDRDFKAWFNRGNALLRLNRYPEAADSFDALIQQEPNNYRAWYNRAIALAAMRRYHDALSCLDTTVAIRPDCHYAWTYRGILLNKLYRFRDALLSFDWSLRYRVPNPNAWYGKASTYALQGKAPQAAQWLRNAIAVNPNLYRVMVQTDPSFSVVLNSPEIQALIQNQRPREASDQDSLEWQQYSSLEDGSNTALNF